MKSHQFQIKEDSSDSKKKDATGFEEAFRKILIEFEDYYLHINTFSAEQMLSLYPDNTFIINNPHLNSNNVEEIDEGVEPSLQLVLRKPLTKEEAELMRQKGLSDRVEKDPDTQNEYTIERFHIVRVSNKFVFKTPTEIVSEINALSKQPSYTSPNFNSSTHRLNVNDALKRLDILKVEMSHIPAATFEAIERKLKPLAGTFNTMNELVEEQCKNNLIPFHLASQKDLFSKLEAIDANDTKDEVGSQKEEVSNNNNADTPATLSASASQSNDNSLIQTAKVRLVHNLSLFNWANTPEIEISENTKISNDNEFTQAKNNLKKTADSAKNTDTVQVSNNKIPAPTMTVSNSYSTDLSVERARRRLKQISSVLGSNLTPNVSPSNPHGMFHPAPSKEGMPQDLHEAHETAIKQADEQAQNANQHYSKPDLESNNELNSALKNAPTLINRIFGLRGGGCRM